MEANDKVSGHPVHQMLIVFPLGLLATSLVLDLFYLGSGDATWTFVATHLIGAGILGGLVAAVFGIVDWLAIPNRTRSKNLGFLHGAGNVLVVLLFVASWYIRRRTPGAPAAIMLSFVAAAVIVATAWLGSQLVERAGTEAPDTSQGD